MFQVDLPQSLAISKEPTTDTQHCEKSICRTQAKRGGEIDLLGSHCHEY